MKPYHFTPDGKTHISRCPCCAGKYKWKDTKHGRKHARAFAKRLIRDVQSQ